MTEIAAFANKPAYDLFDLAPFASDIDLIHTGTTDLTRQIRQAIDEVVPSAFAFRWEIRSVADNQPFWDHIRLSNVVPFDLLSLASDSTSGLTDRWNARRDYETLKFRYIVNGFYATSPLFRANKDGEYFTALSYLRGLLDAHTAAAMALPDHFTTDAVFAQEALASIADVFQRSQNIAVIKSLNQNADLRMKLWYRLNKLRWASPVTTLVNNLAEQSGLSQFLRFVSDRDSRLAEIGALTFGDAVPPSRLLSSSIGGDLFRLPLAIDSWKGGEYADDLFAEYLGEGTTRERAVLASSDIPIITGLKASSEPTNEFIHFEIPIDDVAAIFKRSGRPSEEDLALAVALHDSRREASQARMLFSPAATFWYQRAEGNASLLVRVNCLQILAEAGKILKATGGSATAFMQLFVLMPKTQDYTE